MLTIGALLLGPLQGCALLSRGEPLRVAYYDPQPPAGPPGGQGSSQCLLALGRVDRADGLREEIEFRTSPVEVGYYESRRWTAPPDDYLRRALERSLFEQNRCRRTLSSSSATLDVSLVAFEERRAPESARVAVHVLLHEGAAVLWDATVEATRPAAGGGGFAAIVSAMSDALADVVARVSSGVERRVVADTSMAPGDTGR